MSSMPVFPRLKNGKGVKNTFLPFPWHMSRKAGRWSRYTWCVKIDVVGVMVVFMVHIPVEHCVLWVDGTGILGVC